MLRQRDFPACLFSCFTAAQAGPRAGGVTGSLGLWCLWPSALLRESQGSPVMVHGKPEEHQGEVADVRPGLRDGNAHSSITAMARVRG